MTPVEAARILDTLTAAYPWIELDEPAVDTWVDAIAEARADASTARRAAATWARTNDRFPSLAAFLAAINPPATYQAPDPVEVHPEVTERIVRLWRDALDKVDKRTADTNRGHGGHWHGGPNPCPTCGGIRPDLRPATELD